MNKRLILYIIFISAFSKLGAQRCDVSINGHVFDEGSMTPLSYVNIFIQETSEGAVTDDQGNFTLDSICPGEYHFIFSHIGCEGVKMHFDIERDTFFNIGLSHTPTELGAVVVAGQKDADINQPDLSVNRQKIEDNTNQNLSGILENEAGVHLLKNGSGISKPIVHGLYGNRLTILNNGIVQSGQQWGNDHSPEIDPFSADKITVIKGAGALEYAGGNLGAVILSEPKRIDREPHLHGQVNYIYESNGRGNTLNARLGKYSPKLAWRVNGSLKKYGDRKTAEYFLNNTGLEEANLSIQLEKVWKEKIFFDFYASTFNTRLGVLRGSHVGNITDLERALNSDRPFYTEPDFSYGIDAPKQHVSHHLIKGKAKYFITDDRYLEFVLAGQLNDRKEFDIRRLERESIPALDMTQLSLNFEVKYSHSFGQDWNLIVGDQYIVTDNTNNPDTDIFPLIPDYITIENGVFSALSKNAGNFNLKTGLRYDFEYQDVVTIERGVPPTIRRFDNRFHNFSGLFSLSYDLMKKHSIGWNIGYATRNPAINELYSGGLHQGVSGIEEGDINLKTESAIKNTLEYKWFPSAEFSFNALAYFQSFNDYIFLNPQDEIRPTIRGAFPVFKYEQTDANIYGIDLSTQFTIAHSVLGLLKYSYLKGEDTRNEIPLVFMSPNSFFGSLTYRVQRVVKFPNNLRIEDTEFEISNRLVLEQKNILANQDFAPAPPTYNLFGFKLSTNLISSSYKIRVFAKADNLFNVKYRDYLNRQRYFADDVGVSITVGANVKF